MEMVRRTSLSVLFQAERQQVCEMRLLAVESGRGNGAVFTPVRVILAAASATSLPRMPGYLSPQATASREMKEGLL